MEEDPILREVYRIKDELDRETAGDLQKLFDRFDEFARQHPERMVDLSQGRKISGRKRAVTKS